MCSSFAVLDAVNCHCECFDCNKHWSNCFLPSTIKWVGDKNQGNSHPNIIWSIYLGPLPADMCSSSAGFDKAYRRRKSRVSCQPRASFHVVTLKKVSQFGLSKEFKEILESGSRAQVKTHQGHFGPNALCTLPHKEKKRKPKGHPRHSDVLWWSFLMQHVGKIHWMSCQSSTEIFSCDSWSFNPVDAGFASSLRWTSVPFRSLQSSFDAEAQLILKHDMHHRVLGGRCLHMKAADWHFLGGKHTTGFWAGNKLWRHVILRGHHDVFGRQGTFVPAASPFPSAAAALGSWCMFGWLSFFSPERSNNDKGLSLTREFCSLCVIYKLDEYFLQT